MNSFVLNRHGRLVFPSSVMPQLDLSTVESLQQLDNVIRRDFETKAPSGTDILEKVRTGAYDSRYTLMRDLALNLFWANRFSITMYDKRPTRWADVPRTRSEVFLPVLQTWEEGEAKVIGVAGRSTTSMTSGPPNRVICTAGMRRRQGTAPSTSAPPGPVAFLRCGCSCGRRSAWSSTA